MKRIILCLLAFAAAEAAFAENDTSLKVGTYNIRLQPGDKVRIIIVKED